VAPRGRPCDIFVSEPSPRCKGKIARTVRGRTHTLLAGTGRRPEPSTVLCHEPRGHGWRCPPRRTRDDGGEGADRRKNARRMTSEGRASQTQTRSRPCLLFYFLEGHFFARGGWRGAYWCLLPPDPPQSHGKGGPSAGHVLVAVSTAARRRAVPLWLGLPEKLAAPSRDPGGGRLRFRHPKVPAHVLLEHGLFFTGRKVI
jgi:hypothetical protein